MASIHLVDIELIDPALRLSYERGQNELATRQEAPQPGTSSTPAQGRSENDAAQQSITQSTQSPNVSLDVPQTIRDPETSFLNMHSAVLLQKTGVPDSTSPDQQPAENLAASSPEAQQHSHPCVQQTSGEMLVPETPSVHSTDSVEVIATPALNSVTGNALDISQTPLGTSDPTKEVVGNSVELVKETTSVSEARPESPSQQPSTTLEPGEVNSRTNAYSSPTAPHNGSASLTTDKSYHPSYLPPGSPQNSQDSTSWLLVDQSLRIANPPNPKPLHDQVDPDFNAQTSNRSLLRLRNSQIQSLRSRAAPQPTQASAADNLWEANNALSTADDWDQRPQEFWNYQLLTTNSGQKPSEASTSHNPREANNTKLPHDGWDLVSQDSWNNPKPTSSDVFGSTHVTTEASKANTDTSSENPWEANNATPSYEGWDHEPQDAWGSVASTPSDTWGDTHTTAPPSNENQSHKMGATCSTWGKPSSHPPTTSVWDQPGSHKGWPAAASNLGCWGTPIDSTPLAHTDQWSSSMKTTRESFSEPTVDQPSTRSILRANTESHYTFKAARIVSRDRPPPSRSALRRNSSQRPKSLPTFKAGPDEIIPHPPRRRHPTERRKKIDGNEPGKAASSSVGQKQSTDTTSNPKSSASPALLVKPYLTNGKKRVKPLIQDVGSEDSETLPSAPAKRSRQGSLSGSGASKKASPTRSKPKPKARGSKKRVRLPSNDEDNPEHHYEPNTGVESADFDKPVPSQDMPNTQNTFTESSASSNSLDLKPVAKVDSDAGKSEDDIMYEVLDRHMAEHNWEGLVKNITTAELHPQAKTLQFFVEWEDGSRSWVPYTFMYGRAPQKCLRFYESRIRFSDQSCMPDPSEQGVLPPRPPKKARRL